MADFIKLILNIEPKKRLGSKNGWEEIMSHNFFKEIDFNYVRKVLEKNELFEEFAEKFELAFYKEDIGTYFRAFLFNRIIRASRPKQISF